MKVETAICQHHVKGQQTPQLLSMVLTQITAHDWAQPGMHLFYCLHLVISFSILKLLVSVWGHSWSYKVGFIIWVGIKIHRGLEGAWNWTWVPVMPPKLSGNLAPMSDTLQTSWQSVVVLMPTLSSDENDAITSSDCGNKANQPDGVPLLYQFDIIFTPELQRQVIWV